MVPMIGVLASKPAKSGAIGRGIDSNRIFSTGVA
jgi:hypothetical protein